MSRTHAIVVGGSMAGLSAGRVLSQVYDRVTVIDRDTYPEGVGERSGVPHSRHVHALLARGRLELERLFPGFGNLAREGGAHEIDFGMDFATLRPYGWSQRRPDGLSLLFASRNLIESVVRGLFRRLPNVTLLEQTAVTSLNSATNGCRRVTGVTLRSADGSGPTQLDADLVVDASGRASQAPAWLKALGLEPPQETVVNAFAGYSSRWFQAPSPERWPQEWWWKGIWIDLKEPEVLTAGVLFPVEHGRWIITLGGVAKAYPPTDEDGFMEALGSRLRSPILAEAARLAEPLSPVYGHRTMANRFRHYEQWQERLDGFIALGDAVCAFNPVYGQGMTTGTLSAVVLAECLKRYGPDEPDLPQHFFRAQAKVQENPWRLATGADFRFPATEGNQSAGSRVLDPYMKALFATAIDDHVVRRRLSQVINMLKPPSAFFAPPIMGRVALNALRRRVGKHARTPIPDRPPTRPAGSPLPLSP